MWVTTNELVHSLLEVTDGDRVRVGTERTVILMYLRFACPEFEADQGFRAKTCSVVQIQPRPGGTRREYD